MDTVALVFVGALGVIIMTVIFGMVLMMRKPLGAQNKDSPSHD